jgi:hypothetical protein
LTAGFQPRYQLGLSLSGAISAGAYSAGVLDFLLQALDCWEAAAGDPNVPQPAVGLKVFSGASAGAITAAVGAIALAGDPDSAQFPAGSVIANTQPTKYRFRRLYETWVVKPALVAEDAGTDLLSLSDLDGDDVLSVLNSRLLDEIAAGALDFTTAQAVPARSYVSGSLHIYLTLANLRGTPYYVKFTGGDYGMMQHGDRSHFILNGLGTWTTTSDFADSDAPYYPLQAATLFTPNHAGWQAYGNSALASAAFPVGLAPRTITTNVAEYDGRGWPVDDWQMLQTVKPRFADAWVKNHHKGAFTFTAVDGGVINNDPFEYAFYSLPDQQPPGATKPTQEVTTLDHVDRGVIMIAPFPEQPTLPPDGVPAPGLISAYMALMPALKQQVRFKPTAFALAGDDKVGSRFMISPSRQLAGGADARFPIASGLLNGFGGFVARSFFCIAADKSSNPGKLCARRQWVGICSRGPSTAGGYYGAAAHPAARRGGIGSKGCRMAAHHPGGARHHFTTAAHTAGQGDSEAAEHPKRRACAQAGGTVCSQDHARCNPTQHTPQLSR